MRFHLAHIVPNRRMHRLNGYKDVIDAVAWGLVQLGHQVSYGLNKIGPGSGNIVFGGGAVPLDIQRGLSADTIFYNLDDMHGADGAAAAPEIRNIGEHFHVWDHDTDNLRFWSGLSPRHEPKVVPIGYAPVLERIARADVQDIDALICGAPDHDRLTVFSALAAATLRTVFVSGLYGTGRDELIGRSKTLLALPPAKSMRFEAVGVSYLLANRKAVVSVPDPDPNRNEALRPALVTVGPKDIVHTIGALAADASQREAIETRGYEVFRRRDVRVFLEQALDGVPQ